MLYLYSNQLCRFLEIVFLSGAAMRAVVFDRYGGNEVVGTRDMPEPACGPDDVRIRVRTASVNPVDWKVRSGDVRILTGKRFPKVLGCECAGEIEAVGERVRKFKPGDRVIGWPSVTRLGAFAEYACIKQTSAFPIVQQITFEQAACLPIAGLTALQALRDRGQIAYGKKVLINGASGGVGHFAVQIAKVYGAEVTGVCSRGNVEFVRNIGADHVIDREREDFTRRSDRYDLIFDAVAKRTFGECKKCLAADGIYVSTLPSAAVIASQYITGWFTGKKAKTVWARSSKTDLQWMMEQITSGRITVAIDRVYPLEQAKDALAYSESGKVRGKILLKASS